MRCSKFLNTYAENFIVIDFKELNKGRIDADVAEFFNPVVLIPIERYYVAQMAEVRGHSHITEDICGRLSINENESHRHWG